MSLILLVLLILFLVNGIIKGEKFTKSLLSPITKSPKITEFFGKGGRYDGKTKINVVVQNNPLMVVSFDPNNQTIKVLVIPASTYTQVHGGYGWYPIGSAYGLGQLEKPPVGGITLTKTTSSFLGVPIDYYIKINSEIKTDKDSIRQLKDKFSGVGSAFLWIKAPTWIKNNMDTNLTLSELFRLWWQARSVRVQNVTYADIKADILEELLLPDGSKGYTPKQDQLDLLAEKMFEDSKIQEEGVSVEVVNATDLDGLASKTQRLLENIGVSVVRVSNNDDLLETSVLVVSNSKKKDSYTVARLANSLNLTVKDALYEDSLADVTIILGKDQL